MFFLCVHQALVHTLTTACWYIKYFLIFNFTNHFLLPSCIISFRMHRNVSFTDLFPKAVCLEASWFVVFSINQNWRPTYFCFAFRVREFGIGNYVTKWFLKMFFQIPYHKKNMLVKTMGLKLKEQRNFPFEISN